MNTTMKHFRPGRNCAPLNDETYCIIRQRLANGEFQHDIAADLGLNQGRISEVKTGLRGNPNQLGLL